MEGLPGHTHTHTHTDTDASVLKLPGMHMTIKSMGLKIFRPSGSMRKIILMPLCIMYKRNSLLILSGMEPFFQPCASA